MAAVPGATRAGVAGAFDAGRHRRHTPARMPHFGGTPRAGLVAASGTGMR